MNESKKRYEQRKQAERQELITRALEELKDYKEGMAKITLHPNAAVGGSLSIRTTEPTARWSRLGGGMSRKELLELSKAMDEKDIHYEFYPSRGYVLGLLA